MKARYGTGSLSGFVRCNALTIGNALSGATERANADTQALFIYLYNTDPNLTVSGGRTGNALNDFNANKTITMVDMRGRAPVGLADMGNSASPVLQSLYFGNTPTTLGAAGGSQNAALSSANIAAHTHNVTGTTGDDTPDHSHSGTTGNENADHTHNGSGNTGTESVNHTHGLPQFLQNSGITAQANPGLVIGGTPATLNTGIESASHTHPFSFTTGGISNNHQHSFTTNGPNSRHHHPLTGTTDSGSGSSTPFAVVTPSMVMTFYMKL